MIELFTDIDKQLFLFLNNIHNEFWDSIMWYVSGKLTWIPLYVLIIVLMFRKMGWEKSTVVLVFITLAIVLSDQGSVHFFKNVFQRLRPCHDPDLFGLVHIVNNKCGGDFGFISSHASNTFTVAMFFSLLFRVRVYSIILIVWAIIVSYSRIYLGVHFPLDVIGGAFWGCFSGFILYYFANLILSRNKL